MKRGLLVGMMVLLMTVAPTKRSEAFIWEIVQQAIIAAIKAADLAIQRLQNETIWLQNAQKAVENTFSKLKLDEITEWVSKHKDQYANYFHELEDVKAAINVYQQVREIMVKQSQIVDEYKSAFELFRKDSHFTIGEIQYISQVYSGMVDESLKSLDQLALALNAFQTKMTDGKRLAVIGRVASDVDAVLRDLRQFNQQNVLLSLQRSRDENDLKMIKSYYGLR